MSIQATPSRAELDPVLGKSPTQPPQLEAGHQKPHLLGPPSATSARSKVAQKCSLQPLRCAGHDPGEGGAGQHLWAASPTLHSSCSSEVGATLGCAPSGVAAGRPQLLPFGPQSFGATLPQREGKHP